MSTHGVNVVEIGEVRPHANAERLEIVPVGGWQAVVKKGQFSPGDKAIYIEPDYMVPTEREEFSFLAKDGRTQHRLKAVRLRGVLSFGLLIPVPSNLGDVRPGDDVMAALGIERYEPPVKLAGADDLPADQYPRVHALKFDVESFQRYPLLFEPREPVIITEKLHGANARFLVLDGMFYIGSRTRWLKTDIPHAWKSASDADPRIRDWCERNPGVVLYGEIYGAVQSLKYGAKQGEVRFAAFACSRNGEWVNTDLLLNDAAIPSVPVLYRGPFDASVMAALAEEDSAVEGAPSGHMREGVVVVPQHERYDLQVGRVVLKHISNRYWESAA